jgi:hypothetical protein
VAAGSAALASGGALAATPDPWAHADRDRRAGAAPAALPRRGFPVTRYGAAPCAVAPATAWVSFVEQAQVQTPAADAPDCYAAIARRHRRLQQGRRRPRADPRRQLVLRGPIVLLSNVHVHLAAGAHVYFSNNPEDYAKYGDHDCGARGKLSITRWEGNDCLNYSSMIYAYRPEQYRPDRRRLEQHPRRPGRRAVRRQRGMLVVVQGPRDGPTPAATWPPAAAATSSTARADRGHAESAQPDRRCARSRRT